MNQNHLNFCCRRSVLNLIEIRSVVSDIVPSLVNNAELRSVVLSDALKLLRVSFPVRTGSSATYGPLCHSER
jgi:hypothetical protein